LRVCDAAVADVRKLAAALGKACRSDSLMRDNPAYLAPERLLSKLRERVGTG